MLAFLSFVVSLNASCSGELPKQITSASNMGRNPSTERIYSPLELNGLRAHLVGGDRQQFT